MTERRHISKQYSIVQDPPSSHILHDAAHIYSPRLPPAHTPALHLLFIHHDAMVMLSTGVTTSSGMLPVLTCEHKHKHTRQNERTRLSSIAKASPQPTTCMYALPPPSAEQHQSAQPRYQSVLSLSRFSLRSQYTYKRALPYVDALTLTDTSVTGGHMSTLLAVLVCGGRLQIPGENTIHNTTND